MGVLYLQESIAKGKDRMRQ